MGLKQEIEELLNCKVDILTYNSINPLLKEDILAEAEIFFEKMG